MQPGVAIMKRSFNLSLPLLLAAFLIPQAQSADKDEAKKPESKPAPAAQYVSVGEASGVLAKAPNGSKLTFRVNQLQQGAAGRGRGSPKLKESDLDLEMTADVVVRVLKLPPKRDEKGNKLPYTVEELAALKGKSNLRGYEAKTNDLKANQVVTVHLVRMKGHDGPDAKLYVNRVYIESELPGPAEKKPEEKKPAK
jgi:hypothetical protein